MTNALSGEQKHRKLERLLAFNGGDFCFYCRVELTEARGRRMRTYDHIVPLSSGGGNNLWNLVLSCHRCNHRKGADSFDDFVVVTLGLQRKRIEELRTQLELRERKLRKKRKRPRGPDRLDDLSAVGLGA